MEFFIIPIIGSIFLALLSSPLAVLTHWFRLSWFGETLAHATFLGIGFSVIFSINPFIAILCVSIFLAIITFILIWKNHIENISYYLAILSHGALALGVILTLTQGNNLNIEAWLFGQIINMNGVDIWVLSGLSALVWLFLISQRKAIMLCALHLDLAQIEDVAVHKIRLIILFLLSISIAFSVQFVGILLIASLLVIPSAIARFVSRRPKQFIIMTTLTTLIVVLLGDYFAIKFNWPLGPAIVATSFLLWAVGQLFFMRVKA